MRSPDSQSRENALERVTQLGDHTARMLSELNAGNSPSITAMIDLLQRVARFCDDTKAEKRVQEDNSDVMAAILSITHLVKEQSSDIKAIKNCSLKPRAENTMSYRDALTRSPPSKSEPAPFKANEVIVKINDQSSSDSLRLTKEADLVGLINDTLKKKNISNINVRAVQKLKSGDLAVQTLNQEETQKLKNNSKWTEIFSKQAKTVAKQYPVLVFNSQMKLFRELSPEAFLAHLRLWNQSTLPEISPEYIGPLQPSKTDDEGALILAFRTAKEADSAIHHGIVIGGRVFATTVYNRECRTRQCFNCYKYGHYSPQCTNQTSCGRCAKAHPTPTRDEAHSECCKEDPDKCVVCGGSHAAWSKDCKIRKKEYERIRLARLATPATYGSGYQEKETQVPYFENDAEFQIVQARKKRASAAKKPELTSEPLLSQSRRRPYSPNRMEERRRSRLPARAPKALRPTDTNVKSRTRSGKFGIYSEDIEVSSRNTDHSRTNSTSQIVHDVEMESTDNLSRQ